MAALLLIGGFAICLITAYSVESGKSYNFFLPDGSFYIL